MGQILSEGSALLASLTSLGMFSSPLVPCGEAQLDPGGGVVGGAHKSWIRFRRAESLLEWKQCEEEERGRAVCISHANPVSAAMIESCRNLPPLPGETEELVYY